MQAIESGKPFMSDDFYGSSSDAYGDGVLVNADPSSFKVSKY